MRTTLRSRPALCRQCGNGSLLLLTVMLAWMSTDAAEPEAAATKNEAPPARLLDLKAPDITRILSAEELELLVKGTAEADADHQVRVEGVRELDAPDAPWPGLLAPFWALAHPTQAWRIFAPLPSDQVKDGRN